MRSGKPDRRGKAAPVGGHGLGVVAHVVTHVEAVERRRRDATRAGGRHAPDANGHGAQYSGVDAGDPAGELSGA